MVGWIRRALADTRRIFDRIALIIIKAHVKSLSYWTSIDTRFRINFQFLTGTCRALTIAGCGECFAQFAATSSRACERVVVSGGGTIRRGRPNRVSAPFAELSLWIARAVSIRIQLAFQDGLDRIRISTWTKPPKLRVVLEAVGIVFFVAAKFAVRIAGIARDSRQRNDAKGGVTRNRKTSHCPCAHVSQSTQDGHRKEDAGRYIGRNDAYKTDVRWVCCRFAFAHAVASVEIGKVNGEPDVLSK